MAAGKKLSITFTARQADYLREEADLMGISIADLVRRIIDNFRAPKQRADRSET